MKVDIQSQVLDKFVTKWPRKHTFSKIFGQKHRQDPSLFGQCVKRCTFFIVFFTAAAGSAEVVIMLKSLGQGFRHFYNKGLVIGHA